MKKCFASFLMSLWLLATAVHGETISYTQTFNVDDFIFKQEVYNGASYDVINLKESNIKTGEIGQPDLPVKIIRLLVPYDAMVTNLSVTTVLNENLPGTFTPLPVQMPVPMDGESGVGFVEPDPVVYNSVAPYPVSITTNGGIGGFAEYRYVVIYVYPLQYMPATKQLSYHSSVSFNVEYSRNSYPVTAAVRRSEFSQRAVEEYVRGVIENDESMDAFKSKAPVQKINKSAGLSVTPAPSTDGLPVDYVIITVDSLKNS